MMRSILLLLITLSIAADAAPSRHRLSLEGLNGREFGREIMNNAIDLDETRDVFRELGMMSMSMSLSLSMSYSPPTPPAPAPDVLITTPSPTPAPTTPASSPSTVKSVPVPPSPSTGPFPMTTACPSEDLDGLPTTSLALSLEVDTGTSSTDFLDELSFAVLGAAADAFSLCAPTSPTRKLVDARSLAGATVKGVEIEETPVILNEDCDPETPGNFCHKVIVTTKVYVGENESAVDGGVAVVVAVSDRIQQGSLFDADSPAGDIEAVRLGGGSTTSKSANGNEGNNDGGSDSSPPTGAIVAASIGGAVALLLGAIAYRKATKKKNSDEKPIDSEGSCDESDDTEPPTCQSAGSEEHATGSLGTPDVESAAEA